MKWFFAAIVIPLVVFLAFGAWEAAAKYAFTAAFVCVLIGVVWLCRQTFERVPETIDRSPGPPPGGPKPVEGVDYRLPRVVKLERARLRGTVRDFLDDFDSPVDGIYEVSTAAIYLDKRSWQETCAFKLAGVGPDQIMEPYRLSTLSVSAG